MLSSFCSKDQGTPSCIDTGSSLSSSIYGSPSQSDSTPLMMSQIENFHHRGAFEPTSILTNLQRFMLKTSSFQFRRLQDADAEEDTHTVVTYISVGASTPLQQRRTKCKYFGREFVRLEYPQLDVVPRCLVNPAARQGHKTPKKMHVSWKDTGTGTLLQMVGLNFHSMVGL